MFDWLRIKEKIDNAYVHIGEKVPTDVEAWAKVEDAISLTPPEKEPVLSEPVISLIAEMASVDNWLYTTRDCVIDMVHIPTSLHVLFYGGYGTCDCGLSWTTPDENKALCAAREEYVKARRVRDNTKAREAFMVLVK